MGWKVRWRQLRMACVLYLSVLAGCAAHAPMPPAWVDPDTRRALSTGSERFAGELTVGTTYESFAVWYDHLGTWRITASRYEPAFFDGVVEWQDAEKWKGRQEQEVWQDVIFKVKSMVESPVESPPGSGNHTWVPTYECVIEHLGPNQ